MPSHVTNTKTLLEEIYNHTPVTVITN